MSTMKHGQYVAKIDFDEDESMLAGQVINTRDVITFYGASVEGLRREFEASIKIYEQACRERGLAPEKPYSGNLRLRLDPDLHRRADAAATERGRSLNAFIADAVGRQLAGQD